MRTLGRVWLTIGRRWRTSRRGSRTIGRIFRPIGAMALLLALSACAPWHGPAGEHEVFSSITQLTTGFASTGQAHFSPDMQWILFQATEPDQPHAQLYIARLHLAGPGAPRVDPPIRITPDDSLNTTGHFSPDGRSVIFSSTAGKESPDRPTAGSPRPMRDDRMSLSSGMEIFRVDGWRPALTALRPGESINFARYPITRNDAYDAEASYSPDGRWVVFTSNRTGDPELFVMRPDGSDVTQLTHTPGYDGGAFFSPDARRLVYLSDRQGSGLAQIIVADLEYAHPIAPPKLARQRQLTRGRHVNSHACWHPDGNHLIYASSAQEHPNVELYLMRADGSRQMRITFTDGVDGRPVFSPDGQWLLWSSQRAPDNTTQLFIARFTLPDGA